MKKNKFLIKVFYYQEMMSSEEAREELERRRRKREIEEATETAVQRTIEKMIKEGKIIIKEEK